MNRRQWIITTAAMAASTSSAQSQGIKRAVLHSMLPKELSYAEQFKLAIETGFHAMEARTVPEDTEAQKINDAAQQAGLRIHSVMNMSHWRTPLSSPDPADVEACVDGMRASMRQAQIYGADTVLLVPAVVRADTNYEQAWERSQEQIRKLIPLAEEHDVVIAVEEVWNKFLLTARDFRQYIDEFNHPLIKAYFDVGNIVHYAVPEHWIMELGDRIVKVHLKDYSRAKGFVNLGEGDIDWPAVQKAFAAVGYNGDATVELRGGDRDYLMDLGQRVDSLLGL
jgi:L-ribulose-5-phosphate 3-epimerase